MKVYEDGQLVADDDEMTSWVVRRKAKSTRVVASSRPVVAHNQSELEELITVDGSMKWRPDDPLKLYDLVPVEYAIEQAKAYITASYIPRQSYIELLNLFGTPTCESLHHPKKYQHRAVEDCPVVERITELTKGVTNDQL